MPQKYGLMANSAPNSGGFICGICGSNPTHWTWSDKHGEAMCIQCGTPYQILQYDENHKLIQDTEPRINVKPSWIPVLKQYWNETKRFTGLGAIMIARDYPECVKGRKAFDDWLDEHEDLIPKG